MMIKLMKLRESLFHCWIREREQKFQQINNSGLTTQQARLVANVIKEAMKKNVQEYNQQVSLRDNS